MMTAVELFEKMLKSNSVSLVIEITPKENPFLKMPILIHKDNENSDRWEMVIELIDTSIAPSNRTTIPLRKVRLNLTSKEVVEDINKIL